MVQKANREAKAGLEVYRTLTLAERDYFVVSRLCSHDFPWQEPGRAILVDSRAAVSIMVNEEDHLRTQALTAGWSIEAADRLNHDTVAVLGKHLEYARSERFGYLAASPFNTGVAKRLSAMFHLIGLANARRLPEVMRALNAQGVVIRGLFGESSRAVGAFVQVSITDGTKAAFIGACEYLIQQERLARAQAQGPTLRSKAEEAIQFSRSTPTLSLADCLRVLAWLRWAIVEGECGFHDSPRKIDSALSQLDLMTGWKEQRAAASRADWLRKTIESIKKV